ncbi:aldo/keto reductase [Flavimaricola marinus]|uniref:General stress protein 69 n=1 Tax=Flavimaricola marinus TaxID=1819565 RepID=A0A238L8Q2_9RHOB|nr:aldo/keto reductase [Flavimaricola marinus]SMY06059.1 General stress protein 69 [Flavimaricola marinus]
MKTRKLGANGPDVSAIGLGCMSFAGFFGATDMATSHRCLDAAVDHGITFFDTANVYGPGLSEEVIGAWRKTNKAPITLATKVGIRRDPERPVDNSADHINEQIEGSLKRLGTDHIPLYYIHRRDPAVPVEDLVGTLGRLIDSGKIGGYGLSEISPATLRLAHAERPCTAVQSEYSLWSRMPELGLVQATAELGVAFVPFSPLARGVLSEASLDISNMNPADYRLQIPRFSPENFPRNMAMIDPFKSYVRSRGWTVAGAAIAWVLDQAPHMIPIPGTRTAEHLSEWVNADQISFTDDDRAEIDRLLPVGFAHGDRYSMQQLRSVERYC